MPEPSAISILLVDDEAAHVAAVLRAFEASASGAEIRACATLREYREAVLERAPDLALVDVFLPDGRAMELLGPESKPVSFPLVVMTSHGDEQTAVAAIKAGALDYIVKSPEAFAELPRTVERALREWRLREERGRAIGALRESEALLRESQRVASLGHYSLDVGSEIWTSSETLDRIFGIGPEYFRDVSGWINIVHPDDRETVLAHLRKDVLGDRRSFDKEYRIRRVDDLTERWVHGLGALDLDHEGRPVRLFGTVQDVTDRKLAEAERSEMERRLLQAQKRESLGILAGGVAHDFNNLLLAIMGNLELALLDLDSSSPARERIENAVQAGRRAAELTRQMLAYSGHGQFVVAPVDLTALVRENVVLFRAVVPKSLTLDLPREPGPAVIEADPGQIQQVIINVVANASEAVGEKPGVVTLTTGVLDCDQDYLARSRLDEKPPPGRYAFIEVTDTGCGMDETTKERLFDPFFTTKFVGRGLGMSAVLGIVRAHKGAILVTSAPDRGSTIRLLFPARASGVAAEAALPAPPPLPKRDKRATILVIEDEDAVRWSCQRLCERLGFSTLGASDGAEGLAQYVRHADEIACVLLDLTMPEMDGVATFHALRRFRGDVRVILSSGYSAKDAVERFGEERPAGFLQKPYRGDDLRAKIAEVLAGGG